MNIASLVDQVLDGYIVKTLINVVSGTVTNCMASTAQTGTNVATELSILAVRL